MNNKKILSVCIPNYNRIKKLERLLLEFVGIIKNNNLYEEMQICVSDDFSKENPETLVNSIKESNPEIDISFRRNEKNMGMDYNFLYSVLMANSEFCWIIGNDDMPMGEGIVSIIHKLKTARDIDVIVTPFDKFDEKDGKYISSIYPLGKDVTQECIFTTSNSVELNKLILAVKHNSGLFGFLSNVIFKQENWIKYKDNFTDKMQSIFIQVYINIHTLLQGAQYVYSPIKIVRSSDGDEESNNLQRRCKIFVGLHDVISYFFSGNQLKELQRNVADLYLSAEIWESLSTETRNIIDSEKADIYKKYYIFKENQKERLANQKCIIYGAGELGEVSLARLLLYGANVLGFCDSSSEKQGQSIKGYEIFSPQKLVELYTSEKCYVVIANRAATVEIIRTLKNCNVNNIAIIT